MYKNKEWSQKKKAKEINTKIIRGTINTSKPETDVYHKLCEKFGTDDVVRQHKETRYPFFCDFYIRSTDIFIECNFHWTHGKEPFDETSEIHRRKLELWRSKHTKFYDIAVKVWSEKDPLKIETAKLNGIKLFVFYSVSEFDNWLSGVNSDQNNGRTSV